MPFWSRISGHYRKKTSFPVPGLIMDNDRMLTHLCCVVVNPDEPRTTSWTNVLFILNTCSPTTFLSTQAMEKVGCYPIAPVPLRIQSGEIQTVYPAPRSQFTELNILGMDFLRINKVRAIIKSYNNTFMLDISPPTNRVPDIDKICVNYHPK